MPSDQADIVTSDPTLVGALYTTAEVATMLRVNQRTVQEWIRTGMLTAVRYGRLLRIRQADLAAFGEVLTKGTAAPSGDASASPTPAGAAQD
jgi:excisionase family DNA binding protein